jgi:Skp family chaperone for outer membrane proteins
MDGRWVPASMVAVVSAALSGWSAESRIATVDMVRLVNAHPETEIADSMLGDQVEEYETEKQSLLAEREDLKREFEQARREAEDTALSEAARKAKLEAVEERFTRLRDFERKIRETAAQRQDELRSQRRRLSRRIVSKIRDAIKAFAAQKGYALVLDSSSVGMSGIGGVVYASDSVDITAAIMEVLGIEERDVPEGGRSGVFEEADDGAE